VKYITTSITSGVASSALLGGQFDPSLLSPLW